MSAEPIREASPLPPATAASLSPSTSSASRVRAPTLWLDVEDIADYFAGYANPSGVQRVVIEILEYASKTLPDRVRYCRVSTVTGRVEELGLAQVEAIWSGSPKRPLTASIRRRFMHHVGRPVVDLLMGGIREKRSAKQITPGDVIVCLGSPLDRKYGSRIAALKRRYQLHHALLLHDIMYVSHPAMYPKKLLGSLHAWLPDALSAADLVLTSSNYCRSEILKYGQDKNLNLPPIERIRFGASFGKMASSPDEQIPSFPERFVLFVSTIEVRKNHKLLLRVWQQLIDQYGRDAIPSLVFIGRVGTNVEDLMMQLRASNFLNGKIILHTDLSDSAVQTAYRDCLFTVYPSLCEGWGLPVVESLANNRFCIASNRTAIPEAGQDFVDYFDPDSESETLTAVQRALFEPGYLEERTDRIARHFVAPDWGRCFSDIQIAIDTKLAGMPSSA